MKHNIYKEMLNYLANATKEQLAKDFVEISSNHEGPLAFDYIDSMLKFSQEELFLTEKSLLNTSQSELTEEFDSSGYCLAA